ncbi:MAG: TIGR03435 family protein [Luteitalea sp.]|nr:TIGR03435 family protein [Luteitalea sp.]
MGGITMPGLAGVLSGLVNRVVVDRTGLTGNFDLELEAVEIRASATQGPSSRPSDTDQSIFAALPQQLGLELESTKGPVEIIVIDRAEKPVVQENLVSRVDEGEGITWKRAVASDDRQLLDSRGGKDQAVERVAMVRR